MKKKLFVISLLLLNTFTILAQNKETNQQPVLDYLVFKQYTALDNEIVDSQLEQDRTDAYLISKTTIAFTYNPLGQLATITISGGGYKQILTYYYNSNQQLSAIATNDRTYKANLTYTNNLITEKIEYQQIEGQDAQKVTTITYNNKKQLIKLNETNYNDEEQIEINYEYNKTGEAIAMKNQYGAATITYDNKKTPLTNLPCYITSFPTEHLSFLEPLNYTNYKELHNITRVDTTDYYCLYTYTYNPEDLPLTGMAKKYDKNTTFDHTDFDIIEYHYKK